MKKKIGKRQQNRELLPRIQRIKSKLFGPSLYNLGDLANTVDSAQPA